jgi:maltooligosyltrehalose trehalohydrolase
MTPAVGAVLYDEVTTEFRLWAPEHDRVQVHLVDEGRKLDLSRLGGGYHGAVVENCGAGTRYRFILSDGRDYADPASRSQPEGVHGPSEVVDLAAHRWGDATYRPRPLWDHVMYEVHVGTWTPSGTFDAAIEQLDEVARLGVSAIEIMPVAQFPGRRNWGYDGVFPFAVQNSYGGAAGLQRFVDECHQRDLAVILDVVYNHLGPEGNVLGAYAPYFTDRYVTPWGPALNFDGPDSDDVRAYFFENARQWFGAFHIDGLRLDAVHEIIDRSATPFLAELSDQVHELGDLLGRPCFLIAESADNDPRTVTARASGGLGLDAQWNDDFHHALHAVLTGERSSYYVDYGAVGQVARALGEGFVLQGEHSTFRQRRHGAPSGALAPERLVDFAQNHDHIGNRPAGDRLSTLVGFDQLRLAAAILMVAPGLPLLFMGEEYAETAPFPYFVDHGDPGLVEAVRQGRAREFSDVAERGARFDPADPGTMEAAVLDHSMRFVGEHAALWELHHHLIALRRSVPALRRSSREAARASAHGNVVTLLRTHLEGAVAALFNLGPAPTAALLPDGGPWADLLDPDCPGAGSATAVTLDPWGFRLYRHADPA